MADLFDEEGDLPGAGSADHRRPAEAGDVPPERVAQGPAPESTLGVVGEKILAAKTPTKIVRPEYEPKEVEQNQVIAGNPPAPPLSRSEGGLSSAQRKIAEVAMANPGETHTEIGRLAGYSDRAVTLALNKPQVRMFMSQHLIAAGATLEKVARVIAESMDAEKITHFAHKGVVVDSKIDVDHPTRQKGADMAAELHGAKDDKGMQVNLFQNLTDEQLMEIRAGRARPEDFMQVSA